MSGDDAGGPRPAAFDEPWQAQAYAISQVLIESGRIEPGDWASALGGAIRARLASGAEDTGETYFAAVTDALEAILQMDTKEMGGTVQAWRSAYETTPHGKPVTLNRKA